MEVILQAGIEILLLMMMKMYHLYTLFDTWVFFPYFLSGIAARIVHDNIIQEQLVLHT